MCLRLGIGDLLDVDFSEYLALKCDLSLDSHFQRGMRSPPKHHPRTTADLERANL